MKLRKILATAAILCAGYFSSSMNAQHMVGLNFGVGPSYLESQSPYLVTSADYKYHFWDMLGVGLSVGHAYNSIIPGVTPGFTRQEFNSLLIAANVEFQYKTGTIYPFVGLDFGGSIVEREGFFLQPILGARAWLTDRWTFEFSARNPLWFKGIGSGGVTFNVGAYFTIGNGGSSEPSPR
jgi:hypothetical protein